MASNRNLFLSLSICLLLSPALAQQDSVTLSEEYFRMGMEIFDYEHRKQASELFVLAAQANPKSAKAHFMAGRSIMLSLRKEGSLYYFKKAYQLDPKVDPDILFMLGQAFHYSEKFDSAILLYDRYSRLLARSLDYEKSKKINLVNRKIFECNNAKIMMAQPVDVKVTHLSAEINSPYPDYAPAINADETLMIFTTRRPEENTNVKVAVDHEYYEDIFYSRKVNGEWTPARNMSGPLNNPYHNASVNLSPDGKAMLLYHDSNGGDIYASFLKPDGVTWTTPADLQGINTPYIENSASVTADGQRIFFTSNRPGGYGGTDIYMCTKDAKGRWVNPENLGPQINTELDEDAVFISASGKHLYFSSNGHAGMGDLDIYRSAFNEATQQWNKPINMGYPINSVENDIYFVLTGDEGFAYVSSVREENIGDEDIYKLDIRNWKEPAFNQTDFADAIQTLEEEAPALVMAPTPVISPQPTSTNYPISIKFVVFVAEGSSRKPVAANVSLSSQHGKEIILSQVAEGTYETDILNNLNSAVRYKLHISQTDYIPYTGSYFFGANQTQPVLRDTIYLDKMVVNYNRILNVYFSHDSDVPNTFEDIRYLEQLMKTSSSVRVEISGHTDDLGSAEYNVLLSKRRAEAVKKQLVQSGIDESRISVKGYGSEKPISENKTREGRQLNRRTEFTILEK